MGKCYEDSHDIVCGGGGILHMGNIVALAHAILTGG